MKNARREDSLMVAKREDSLIVAEREDSLMVAETPGRHSIPDNWVIKLFHEDELSNA